MDSIAGKGHWTCDDSQIKPNHRSCHLGVGCAFSRVPGRVQPAAHRFARPDRSAADRHSVHADHGRSQPYSRTERRAIANHRLGPNRRTGLLQCIDLRRRPPGKRTTASCHPSTRRNRRRVQRVDWGKSPPMHTHCRLPGSTLLHWRRAGDQLRAGGCPDPAVSTDWRPNGGSVVRGRLHIAGASDANNDTPALVPAHP
jgi:hypothetical protein